jgi:hypothetical protein
MENEVPVLTVQDMIQAAKANSPSNFGDMFTQLIGPKIADALAREKEMLAQDYLAPEDDEQDTTTETEDQDEDTQADTGGVSQTSTDDQG